LPSAFRRLDDELIAQKTFRTFQATELVKHSFDCAEVESCILRDNLPSTVSRS
jgi:hypothetical protein